MQSNNKTQLISLNILLIFLFNFSFSQKNQLHFKSDINFIDGMSLTTFLDLNTTQDNFSITSPEDSDIRIFGSKAKLGRVFGKSPKNGIIITISGQQKKDSLLGDSNIPMIGKLKFKGVLKNENLSGELLNTEGIKIGLLSGTISVENKIDYSYLYPMIIKTVQDNIYSSSVLKTKDWETFLKESKNICYTAEDDIDLYYGFNILAQQLPFTHFRLNMKKEVIEKEVKQFSKTQKSVIFKEKNVSTAYLLIKNFSNTTEELADILPKIVSNKNYKNLIIDLRNNGGGGIEAAFEFAKNIIDKDIETGYFVTNKLNYSSFEPELFNKLPELQPKSTDDFIAELKVTPGVKLVFKKPNNPVF